MTFKKTNKQSELDELFTPEDQHLLKKVMGMYLALFMSIIISIGLVAAALIYFAVQCIKGGF
jgi:hypothetical protein